MTRTTKSVVKVVVVLLAVLALGPVWARAQWVPGQRMTEAMGKVMGAGQEISRRTPFGFDGPGDICLMGAFVQEGATVSFLRHLQAGETYALVGGGDNNAQDVDIEILDAQGRVVARDTQADAAPAVVFKPARAGRYSIRVTLYRASRAGFVATAIMRQGGYEVSRNNLIRAFGGLVAMGNGLSDKGVDTIFLEENNQWAVWGSILTQGQALTIDNIRLGRGQRVLVAMGDSQARDVNLHLLNDSGGVLKEDTDPDANPVVTYRAVADSNYSLRFTNVSSRGVSLVMAGIFQVTASR